MILCVGVRIARRGEDMLTSKYIGEEEGVKDKWGILTSGVSRRIV